MTSSGPLAATVGPEGEAAPTKHLVLIRHAKSSWADPGLIDHDRPLSARGRKAAAAVGRDLHQSGLEPDLVLCSSALRARQTLEYLRFAAGTEVAIESSLYGAAAASLLTRIGRIPSGVGSAVLIAHNPGLEELARILAGAGNDLAAADKFPTAAVAEFRYLTPTWAAVGPGREVRGGLVRFVVPRDLG
jgi:phosphohistidine phosphatase